MKTRTIGIVVIMLGIAMTIFTGFNFKTTEKVVDLGLIQINKEENHPMQWKPILGMLIVVVGGVLVAKGDGAKN